jgi:quinol-cytochrome oxidoreductase complex cytochrome b subunit
MAETRGRMGAVGRWLDERVGFSALAPLAKKKTVPKHRYSGWYYVGGMVLFLFMLQVCTGILLLFYYRPSAGEAYESVQFLMANVKFGWLIRSIHAWGANLMIFTVFLHLFSTLLLKSYRTPRELTWMTGVALFAVVLGLGFTGYLLPWNQLSFFATRVGTEIPGVMPLIGPFVLKTLRGGEDVTGATLTRFYALHTSLLPGIAILLIGLHVLLVQKLGMSVPPSVERKGGARASVPFFPNFLMRDLIGWLLAVAILASLAAFFPAELGKKADPFAPAPAGIRPEWYFMFMFQTLKFLPAHVFGIPGDVLGIIAFGLAGILLLLIPFLDHRTKRSEPRTGWTYVGVAALVYILALTYVAYTVNPKQ